MKSENTELFQNSQHHFGCEYSIFSLKDASPKQISIILKIRISLLGMCMNIPSSKGNLGISCWRKAYTSDIFHFQFSIFWSNWI